MKKHILTGTKRTLIGKQVKTIRALGQIPATIYGKQLVSVSIAVLRDEFASLYKEAGKAGLIELSIDKKIHPVLIHDVQVHPVTDEVLHIEFHQVDLKEKVHAKIAVEHIGESPAVTQKLGVFLVIHDSVEVEALPAELPEKLSVDVSVLADVNQEITAAAVVLPSGVVLLTDPTTILMKIGPLVTKEAEQQATTEAAEAAEAATTTEGAVNPSEPTAGTPEATQKPPEQK